MRLASAIATLLLLGAIVLAARSRNTELAQRSTRMSEPVWLKLTFGLDGKVVSWDGSAAIRNGRILQSAPWSFEKRDQFDSEAHKWSCTTAVLKGRSASSLAEPQRGVLLEIKPPSQAQLTVETRQGSFTVNVEALEAGRPQLYLSGRASAELLGTSIPLPKTKQVDQDISTDDDFPSGAIDSNGHRRVAWIGYEDAAKRDHLWVRDLDAPNGMAEELVTAREQLDPKLVTGADGNLHLFWAAPVDGNWEIWTAKRDRKGWSVPRRMTNAEGTDFCLATARGPNGDIWLAWQAFRGDNSDTDGYKRFYELPHLVRDGNKRLWLFFRLNRQGYAGHPRMGANWEFFATTFADGNWIEPILLPLSVGRQNQRVSTCVDSAGRVQVAWSAGDHLVDAPQRVRDANRFSTDSGRAGPMPQPTKLSWMCVWAMP